MGDDLTDAAVGLENSSIIGRLLDEISWEGNAKRYRGGGRGMENVLTAEVLYPLSFLPRIAFLGEVIAGAHGADGARGRVIAEIEDTLISVLPGDVPLEGSPIRVQPDAVLTSASAYTLVEAKRIRPSRFQTDQLAREFLATLQQAESRTPLLLIILGSPPPVAVAKIPARVQLDEAIVQRLDHVATDGQLSSSTGDLISRIPDTLAWTTWSEIRAALMANRDRFSGSPDGLAATVTRLCDAAVAAIDWHS